MSNFLTDGRTALVDALRADAEIDARVRTYFTFGPGLAERRSLEPAACPALTVLPGGARPACVASIEREVPHALTVEIATAGQDVAPCEELAALVLDRLRACDEDCLGLTAQGLEGVFAGPVRWRMRPAPDAPRPLWVASIEVTLLWRRLD